MNTGFQYFPEKLFNTPVRMTDINNQFSFTSATKEVYYTIKAGDWNDKTIWETVSGRIGKVPSQSTDDVYIGHVVTFTQTSKLTLNNIFVLNTGSISINQNSFNLTISNVYTYGTFSFTGSSNVVINNIYVYNTFTAGNNIVISYAFIYLNGVLNVNSVGSGTISVTNLYCYGLIDLSAGSCIISLFSVFALTNLIAGSLGTVKFTKPVPVNVIPFTYYNLFFADTAVGYNKYLTADLTCNNLNIQLFNFGQFQLLTYNLTVNGTTSIGCYLSKTGSGNVLFVGAVTNNYTVDFRTGNPSVEVRSGFSDNGFFYTGSGTWTFSTNNQTFSNNYTNYIFDWTVLVSGAITLTIGGTQPVIFNSVNGDNAGSVLTNNGTIYFATSGTPMSTGTFNNGTGTSGTGLGFIMTSNFTIPYTSFQKLYIAGTSGIKTLSGNTTVLQSLQLNGVGCTLELSTFDFTVTTTFALNGGKLSKTGAGSVLFVGLITWANSSNVFIDFSGGNPSVELRGGMACINQNTGQFKSGTGTWTFSTNNQSITGQGTLLFPFSGNVLVSGAITLTVSAPGYTMFITITGTLNGDNVSSIYNNSTNSRTEYQNAQRPMLTGQLQCDNAANIFKYNMLGAQDVTGGTYRTLEFGGSGVKTLQGNVVVNVTAGGSWSITGSASINYNGYTITTI